FPHALNNTKTIAENCQIELAFNQQLLPKFPLKSETSKEALKRLCYEGLPLRYNEDNQQAIARLNYELKIIDELDFIDYFLIVADIVIFTKQSNTAVVPRRGSAVGSIVAYLLDITSIESLKYDILFERFLNQNRAPLPDFDIDFSDERREEVIEYVKEKYGQ